MTARTPTIGLCMIVKNEAHILRRCFDAARPLVDYALVVDTGSTDSTVELAGQLLNEFGMPGRVLVDNWRDFASNRSYAIEQIRSVSDVDYVLMLDADDLLVIDKDVDPRNWKAGLEADVYDVPLICGAQSYTRPQIWRNQLPLRYRGVLHEFLEVPGSVKRAPARGIHIEAVQDSARNRNPKKYAEDARVLSEAVARETDPFMRARYTFYEARCQESAENDDAALDAFRRRAEMGFWKEEVYISLLAVARISERKGLPTGEVIAAVLAAQEASPGRSEALHLAMRYCRLKKMHQAAWIFACQAANMPRPSEGLFLDTPVYDWRLDDERSLAAYYVGRYEESLELCEALLANPKLPDKQRPRIESNAAYARDGLAKARESSSGANGRHRSMVSRPFGEGLLLAKAGGDKLFALDATERFLWQHFANGKARTQLPSLLAAQKEISLEAAQKETGAVFDKWRAEGLVAPRKHLLSLSLGNLGVEVSSESRELHESLSTLFAALATKTDGRSATLFALRGEGPFRLLRDGRLLSESDSPGAALRALLRAMAEVARNRLPWQLATEAAAVGGDAGAVLLAGPDGDARAMLTAALCHDGESELIAEGLALVNGRDLSVHPLPLPLALNQSAVEALGKLLPDLNDLPPFECGKDAFRFWPSPRPGRQARTLRAVLFPSRREGEEASMQPLAPLEAIDLLLKGDLRYRSQANAEALPQVSDRLQAVPAWRLVYEHAEDAKRLVTDQMRR